jgi:hypothetical protein
MNFGTDIAFGTLGSELSAYHKTLVQIQRVDHVLLQFEQIVSTHQHMLLQLLQHATRHKIGTSRY